MFEISGPSTYFSTCRRPHFRTRVRVDRTFRPKAGLSLHVRGERRPRWPRHSAAFQDLEDFSPPPLGFRSSIGLYG